MKALIYVGISFCVVAIILTAIMFAMYPLKYKKDIKAAAEIYDLDPVLIAAVINAESSFHPNAISDKGAVGLMQVMPPTAEWVSQQVNIEVSSETLKEPRTNILIGTFYLNYLLEKFKDLKTALIAYNAGEGNVITWLADGRYSAEAEGHSVLVTCPFPSTNKYVEKILNGMNIYKIRF